MDCSKATSELIDRMDAAGAVIIVMHRNGAFEIGMSLIDHPKVVDEMIPIAKMIEQYIRDKFPNAVSSEGNGIFAEKENKN